MSNPGIRRDWNSDSPVGDHIWAQAVHAVVERRLSLRQASLAYGLQQAALHRLVRQHTLQQLRHNPPPTRALSSAIHTSDDRFTAPVASSNPNDRYVFPRLNPPALGHSNPNNAPLPSVTNVRTPPSVCELTPELNEEVVLALREQYMQQQQYDDYETSDGHYKRLEGYADADIADVVRTIVSQNGRRALPLDFPSFSWITMFKRENEFVDVNNLVRGRNRTISGNLPLQRQQQESYICRYELEQQQYELEAQQHRGGQLRYRNYRQPVAPPPLSPMRHNPIQRRTSYGWEDVDDVVDGGDNLLPQRQQRLRYYQPRDGHNFRRSPSAGSSNGRSGHSDSNASDRNYRQSNLVSAKVWEAAMEDVGIHGMSLRNAAKAHGVHFAALHRRLKKRQQHKLNMPCEPNYIPFEDEAGVVRVIHARADMGVLLTFTELVDLLKRTALKHRSELPEDIANALMRRFQSRVEQSVRHLIVDWPALPNNVLYRLRDTSSSEDGKGGMAASVAAVDPGKSRLPSIISGSSGEGGSLSSSRSSSSLSPHPQSVAAFPETRKSPVGPAPPPIWSNNKDNDSSASNVESGSINNNGDGNTPAATVSPTDESETNPPCVIFRL